MPPLNYDTSVEPGEGGDLPPLKPGDYEFKVEEADETTFGTGNQGLKVKLLVGYENGRDVPCYENMVYTPAALWKLKSFLEALGFDYKKPPDAWELKGKTGWAKFGLNEKGYFKVKAYDPVHPAEKAHHSKPKPAAQSEDSDVPW